MNGAEVLIDALKKESVDIIAEEAYSANIFIKMLLNTVGELASAKQSENVFMVKALQLFCRCC